jgi:hypothetical protein
LDECLRQSTGSGLNIPTAEKYFRDWLDAKEQVGRTSASTLTRYAPILERFVAFLPDIRRRSSLAPQKTAKRKKGTDKNTVVDLHQDLMTYETSESKYGDFLRNRGHLQLARDALLEAIWGSLRNNS